MKLDFKISCLFKEPNLNTLTIAMPGTPVAFLLCHTKCEQKMHQMFTSVSRRFMKLSWNRTLIFTPTLQMMFIVQTLVCKKQQQHTHLYNANIMSPWPIAVCTFSLGNWIGDEFVYHNKCEGQKNNALFRENASNSLPLNAISNSLP